jgi:hypothetical protein
MKNTRNLNGYSVVYRPDSPLAMTTYDWDGYVYEHIQVYFETSGITPDSNQVVHHLDCDKTNNDPENLILLSRADHVKIHSWLERGIGIKSPIRVVKRCSVCGGPLKRAQVNYCSMEYHHKAKAQDVPSKVILEKLLSETTQEAIGKMYGVSGSAVRKWRRKYGIIT